VVEVCLEWPLLLTPYRIATCRTNTVGTQITSLLTFSLPMLRLHLRATLRTETLVRSEEELPDKATEQLIHLPDH